MLQVEQLTGWLEKLLEGPSVSPSVGQRAVAVVSKLMEGDSMALSASASRWRPRRLLMPRTHTHTHTLDVVSRFPVIRLIRAVDDLGVKLLVTADVEVVSSASLALAVKKVHGTDFPPTFVYILDMDRIQVTLGRRICEIQLRKGLNFEEVSVCLFLQFRSSSRSWSGGSSLGSVFLPSSLTAGLSAQQQQQAGRLQVTYYSKPALFQVPGPLTCIHPLSAAHAGTDCL